MKFLLKCFKCKELLQRFLYLITSKCWKIRPVDWNLAQICFAKLVLAWVLFSTSVDTSTSHFFCVFWRITHTRELCLDLHAQLIPFSNPHALWWYAASASVSRALHALNTTALVWWLHRAPQHTFKTFFVRRSTLYSYSQKPRLVEVCQTKSFNTNILNTSST